MEFEFIQNKVTQKELIEIKQIDQINSFSLLVDNINLKMSELILKIIAE